MGSTLGKLAIAIAVGACHGSHSVPPSVVPQLATQLPPGSIDGTVVDSATVVPLPNTQLWLVADPQGPDDSTNVLAATLADALGHFSFRTKRLGTYVLRARHICHQTRDAPIGLTDRGGLVVTIVLPPDKRLRAILPQFCS